MVLGGEPPPKIFTVGLSYWRISKETYYGLPTRRVLEESGEAVLGQKDLGVCTTKSPGTPQKSPGSPNGGWWWFFADKQVE